MCNSIKRLVFSKHKALLLAKDYIKGFLINLFNQIHAFLRLCGEEMSLLGNLFVSLALKGE